MINAALSILSGILLALSFPKPDMGFLAWIALVPFFIVIVRSNDKGKGSSLIYGFLFGITYFGGVLLWMTSLSRWVGLWGWTAWLALALYQALFIVFFAFAASLLLKNMKKLPAVLLTTALWLFVEWLRQWGEFGSPAGILAYTQYLNLPVIQIARFAGIYGVSGLLVLVNLTIAALLAEDGDFVKRTVKLQYLPVLTLFAVFAVLSYGLYSLGKAPYKGPVSVKIALMQPNFDQALKLNFNNKDLMVNSLIEMSRRTLAEKPDIIIWPETSVISFLERDAVSLAKMKALVKEGRCYLIAGVFGTSWGRAYNSVYVLSPEGKLVSRYDKQHLMPFGEYLPFKPLLYPFLKGTGYFALDQSPGTGEGALAAAGKKIGAMICFESLFGYIARDRSKGADFLLNITNDAWFGNSAGAYQHIAAAPFRAIENRKYFIQCANTGISAIVDPYGRFVKRTRLNEKKHIIFPSPLTLHK